MSPPHPAHTLESQLQEVLDPLAICHPTAATCTSRFHPLLPVKQVQWPGRMNSFLCALAGTIPFTQNAFPLLPIHQLRGACESHFLGEISPKARSLPLSELPALLAARCKGCRSLLGLLM